MNALIIYESMYGNTHLVASAIAEGLRAHGEATIVAVDDVGGPTHALLERRDGIRATGRALNLSRLPGTFPL